MTDPARSEQVVEDYKQRKLAQNALRRIHALIKGFEEDDAFDRKAARIGVLLAIVLLAGALIYLGSTDSIILG